VSEDVFHKNKWRFFLAWVAMIWDQAIARIQCVPKS